MVEEYKSFYESHTLVPPVQFMHLSTAHTSGESCHRLKSGNKPKTEKTGENARSNTRFQTVGLLLTFENIQNVPVCFCVCGTI